LKKYKVHCIGCASLFFLEGKKNRPLCVATVKFVEGPLRKKIDVLGVTSAEERNVHNDCEYRRAISRRAWEIKKWLLWRLNDDGNKERIKKADLQDYSVKKEFDRKREILAWEKRDTSKDEGTVKEESTGKGKGIGKKISSSAKTQEGLFPDGRTDDHNEPGSTDQVKSKDIQDAGNSNRLKGKHVHKDKS